MTSQNPHDLLDPLSTGFGGRDELLAALEAAVTPGSAPSVFAVFGLEGLADYRDLFGQRETQTLLVGLAGRIEDALGAGAACFQPRQDEFAVIVHGSIPEAQPLLGAAAAALHEPGTDVTASYGIVQLPEDARTPREALMFVDERLRFAAPSRPERERRAAPRPTSRAPRADTLTVGREGRGLAALAAMFSAGRV